MRSRRYESSEPTLEEMLADPIVWMVMKSDGVDLHELQNLLRSVGANLAGGEQHSLLATSNPSGRYRRGVGIMLLSHQNEVFVGKRADKKSDAWQMPQGGIEEGEEPLAAVFRELREEIGTDNARIIAESKTWLHYDLPPGLRKGRGRRWLGQQQKWFVMRFQGTDADIDVANENAEFSAWKWVSAALLPELIVSFKRQMYVDLLREFGEAGAIPPLSAE